MPTQHGSASLVRCKSIFFFKFWPFSFSHRLTLKLSKLVWSARKELWRQEIEKHRCHCGLGHPTALWLTTIKSTRSFHACGVAWMNFHSLNRDIPCSMNQISFIEKEFSDAATRAWNLQGWFITWFLARVQTPTNQPTISHPLTHTAVCCYFIPIIALFPLHRVQHSITTHCSLKKNIGHCTYNINCWFIVIWWHLIYGRCNSFNLIV